MDAVFLLTLPTAEELHPCLPASSQEASALSFPGLQGETALSPFLLSLISRTACSTLVPAWSLGGADSHCARGWHCGLMLCHGCICLLLLSPPCQI